MRIKYTEIRPRDSVWIRSTVDKEGRWFIVIGEVAHASADSVMLFDSQTWAYVLSRGPSVTKDTNSILMADRIDTIITLGS